MFKKKKNENMDFTPSDLSKLTKKGARETGKESSYGEFRQARDAEVLDKTRRRKRLLFWLSLLLIAFLLCLWLLMFWWTRAGDLVIDVDRLADQKGIALSETSDFKHPETILSGKGVDNVTNITYAWLTDNMTVDGDISYLDNYVSKKDKSIDGGSHNGDSNNNRKKLTGANSAGENYLAYTFYCKNVGDKTLNYDATLINKGAAKSMDEAVRVIVFKNGEPTVYAHKKHESNEPEDDSKFIPKSLNSKAWINDKEIMTTKSENFKPNQVDKYTVLMWVEGNDPECINEILGGHMKMSMTFSVEDDKET